MLWTIWSQEPHSNYHHLDYFHLALILIIPLLILIHLAPHHRCFPTYQRNEREFQGWQSIVMSSKALLHILPYYRDDGDGGGDDDGDGDNGDDRIQHGGGIQYNAHSKA